MKKLVILLFACIVAAVAVAQQLASVNSAMATSASPAFTWTETVHNFGGIKAGEAVSHKFTFTNSGNEMLLITSVIPSCGCTVADYSKDPIPAGGSGYVTATYNAAKPGVFSKTVTVKANTGDEVVLLTVKGEVVE